MNSFKKGCIQVFCKAKPFGVKICEVMHRRVSLNYVRELMHDFLNYEGSMQYRLVQQTQCSEIDEKLDHLQWTGNLAKIIKKFAFYTFNFILRLMKLLKFVVASCSNRLTYFRSICAIFADTYTSCKIIDMKITYTSLILGNINAKIVVFCYLEMTAFIVYVRIMRVMLPGVVLPVGKRLKGVLDKIVRDYYGMADLMPVNRYITIFITLYHSSVTLASFHEAMKKRVTTNKIDIGTVCKHCICVFIAVVLLATPIASSAWQDVPPANDHLTLSVWSLPGRKNTCALPDDFSTLIFFYLYKHAYSKHQFLKKYVNSLFHVVILLSLKNFLHHFSTFLYFQMMESDILMGPITLYVNENLNFKIKLRVKRPHPGMVTQPSFKIHYETIIIRYCIQLIIILIQEKNALKSVIKLVYQIIINGCTEINRCVNITSKWCLFDVRNLTDKKKNINKFVITNAFIGLQRTCILDSNIICYHTYEVNKAKQNLQMCTYGHCTHV
ncbi:hypothetical protein KUTeg_018103 [Tegillarca granosa]|uniref:Uncharacterized protein n=1 Tax=Tegillarca granosa TaxID=220873 RepID=A0ABQ9EH41_TEGGR|nr:hypothetical protein KUTeg_018103 [Tegillarca granosa]